MNRTIKIKVDLMRETNNIEHWNYLVDEEIKKTDFYKENKTAQDIEYEIIINSVKKYGLATLRARFRYE